MNKSILKLSSITFIGGIVGRGLRYGINIIISRGLGTEALGVFTMGLILLQASAMVSRLGLDHATQKYIPIYLSENNNRKFSGTIVVAVIIPLIIGTLIGLLLYSINPVISSRTNYSLQGELSVFLLGIPLFASMMVVRSITKGLKETKYSVYIRDICQSGLAIIFAILASYVFSQFRILSVGYVISIAISLVLGLYFIINESKDLLVTKPQVEILKLLKYSVPLTAVMVSQYLISWTDILMLGSLTTAKSVGLYQAAFQTSALLTIILYSVNSIFPSLASDLYSSGNLAKLNKLYTTSTKWVSYLTAFLLLLVIVFSKEILLIFEIQNEIARKTLIILSTTQAIVAATGPAGFLLSMSGYERIESVNTVSVLAINIVLNYILITKYGILGAAIATSVSLLLLNFLRLIEIYIYYDIIPYRRDYIWGIASILTSLITVLYFKSLIDDPFISMIISSIAGGVVFISLTYSIVFQQDDRILFESLNDR